MARRKSTTGASSDDLAIIVPADADLASATMNADVFLSNAITGAGACDPSDESTAIESVESMASIVAASAVSDAESASMAITASADRYRIASRAARVMCDRALSVDRVATMLADNLAKRAGLGARIPRVWLELSGVSHALKCWLPGTCDSRDLVTPWPSLKTRPFYRVPMSVFSASMRGDRNMDWGGFICDYWSRINPQLIDDDLVSSIVAMPRDAARATLRDYLIRR